MKLFPILFLLSSGLASAATIRLVDSIGGAIPDGSISGLSRSLTLDRPGEDIVGITVDLSISSLSGNNAFLGDLYVYLTDGTTLVTLANRPGRSASNPDGYDDNFGFAVTFDDTATIDFHTYRLGVTGDNDSPLLAIMTGTFQADGRLTSPLDVVTDDPRTSQLSDFFGLSAERTFTLFAADLSTGAMHQVNEWALNVETIPEPSAALLGILSLGVLAFRRSRPRPTRSLRDA